jgi:hypothetical protein
MNYPTLLYTYIVTINRCTKIVFLSLLIIVAVFTSVQDVMMIMFKKLNIKCIKLTFFSQFSYDNE